MNRGEILKIKNLKDIRKNKKMTQKDLAEKTGLSISTIQGYEQGKYHPKGESVQKIAEALNVPIESLLDFSYTPEEVEKYKKILEPLTGQWIRIDTKTEKKLFLKSKELNEQGQKKLYNYSCDLLEIPKYRADTAPDQGAPAPDEPPSPNQEEPDKN